MKILIATSEALPFAKTGGLADICGILPEALINLGTDVHVILPKYKCIPTPNKQVGTIKVQIGEKEKKGIVWEETTPNGVKFLFIQHNPYFNRDELYGDKDGDYDDNAERFFFFSRAVIETLKLLDWQPDVIHIHDWQTALVPLLLKTTYKKSSYARIPTIFTIHNLAYQGVFPTEKLYLFGDLGVELFTMDKLEFYGQINFMKGAFRFADILTTVSKQYAREIQTVQYGCGVEGCLVERQKNLYGIINGIDYNEWNPSTDKYIYKNYSNQNLLTKRENKNKLIKEANLKPSNNSPLLGMVTRLADQKGLDLLATIIDDVLNMDVRFILLGTGDRKYHELFVGLAEKYKDKVGINLKFNNTIAHKIYAGSDIFLMPSRFEPCGLGQLICLKYGTVPIVHRTGGLADTVTEFDPIAGKGNGFVFISYRAEEFLASIKRAIYTFSYKPDEFKRIQINGMQGNFSWENSAKEYIELYHRAISNVSI